METIFQLLFSEFKQFTRASEQNCLDVAARLTAEVDRICTESKRIQSSGEIETWAITLANHRLKQCLKYYKLGSRQGRVELHSSLSAIVYRYITPPQARSSYQARLNLIEDFLQGFYVEAWKAFLRENQLPEKYHPQNLLAVAEYMAFTERYAKRRITISARRNQQLIVLRAQTFSQQQPPEISVDMEQAAEGNIVDSDTPGNEPTIQQVRQMMVSRAPEPAEDSLRQEVIKQLMKYLDEKQQKDCADYFALRLQDLQANEIEEILNLTPRERDYLQQRFKYHLIRFAMLHQWELVHQWLEVDLEHNLGLTSQDWQDFRLTLSPLQLDILRLKQEKVGDEKISQIVGCTVTQVQKHWLKLLEKAWELRNK